MSEGEAIATLEEPTVAESEKVKAINGMKEVDEVKLQNGESEKPQINGDMEKGEELDSGEQNGQEDGGFEDIPKQKLSVAVERTRDSEKEKGEKNGEKMDVDGEKKDGGDGKEEKGSMSDSAVDDEGENSEVEKCTDDKSEEKNSEMDEKSDGKEVKDDEDKSNDSEKKSEGKDGESKTGEKEKKGDASEEKTTSDDKNGEKEKTPAKKDKNESNNNNNSTTKTKEGKRSKGNSAEEVQEIPVTRQLRARKTPKKYTEDDDDIKITNEVIKDDSSDIEMIEESDPLAISDADVKKIQKEKKEITIKSKDPNVIIIDTNTLLKNQGNLAAAVAQSNTGSGVQTIHPRSTSSSSSTTVTNMSIQSAIQAITGGAPAQGLQSAYITALQQVLVSQGGQVPMNPQHLAQLQQYYNSLGHLQDDAYVIEAPSFIVPYVMEGKPKEPIKDFLKRINKELEEFEKKELEEDENKRKEEERKKREAARLERRRRREEEKQKKLAAGEEVAEEEESEDEEEKKEKEEKAKEEKKEKDKDDKSKKDGEKKDEDEKMETDNDKEEGENEEEKGDSDTETKDAEEKGDSEKGNEKGAEVKDKKKEDEKEESEKESKETDSAKSDQEDKDKDEGETKKVDVEEKEKKDEDKDKDGKKDAETGDDDDKENKDKSDSDSVVDVEKDGQKGEDLSYLGNIQSQLHYKISQWEPYYKSALGKFMLELGLNQAQEFLQSDLLRMQKRKLDKMKTQPSREGIMSVKLLEKQLEVTRKKNAHLQVPLRICKFCTFKTESEMVMERHLESPHMVNYTYKCNFCDFETRGPQIILFHMEAEHNIRGRLERAPAFFQCSLCPYEDNNKSKMTRHSFSCAKKYKPERNCELLDWEPPAKIPKIHRGRPNTLGKAFEPVKMPNLLPKNLTGMNINLQGSNMIQSSSAAALSAGRGRGRPIGSYKNVLPMQNQGRGVNTVNSGSLVYTNRGTTTSSSSTGSQQFTLGNQMFHLVNGHLVPMSSGSGSVSSVSISSQSGGRVPRILPSSNTSSSSSTNPVSLIPGLGTSSSITIQSVQTKGGNTKSPQQPSISITPLPRGGQQSSQGGGGKGGSSQTRGGDSGGKPSFVICEICDGYIKDLEQLRNHMNLIHKVKIHPKMIYNRPPLNCQKCQHRFFTDQGLERHLLGTHGLVTSSMQEAANKGKDAGRCPICGKVFQWKLLNHVSRDHKMTLKPAHLSYKCTVCTATFNMYRLFENHVYSAHSVVNKNKGESGKKSGGSSDSPLKINDEITIIPQPAVGKTKTTTTSSSSSSSEKTISKKSEGTPTMSKEITITKVGSRPTRRSGGSVEVISLDESPKKSSSSSSSGSDKKRSSKDNLGNSSKKSKTSS